MNLDLASIPLAWLAGVLSILSPCVWPLIPVVMASASVQGRTGPLFLALGLSTSFAIAGSILTLVLLNAGLDPVGFRWFAAVLLILVGLTLIIKPLSDWLSLKLSMLSSRVNTNKLESSSAFGQFGVGLLLGLVWLPCVGPTLGAAIALASVGQDLGMAFVTMFAFGIGTASALIAASVISTKVLKRWRPSLFKNVSSAKLILGYVLVFLGVMVLSGLDKALESLALQYLPDWALGL